MLSSTTVLDAARRVQWAAAANGWAGYGPPALGSPIRLLCNYCRVPGRLPVEEHLAGSGLETLRLAGCMEQRRPITADVANGVWQFAAPATPQPGAVRGPAAIRRR